MATLWFCVVFCVVCVNADYYDTFTGSKITRKRYEDMRNMSLVPWCAMEVAACDASAPRRMDLTCNNLQQPTRGAMATPFLRLLPADYQDDAACGAQCRGESCRTRALRVALMADGRAASHTHTQLITIVALLNTADTTSVHDTVNYVLGTVDCCRSGADARCAPIPVSETDPHLYASDVRCLNMTTPLSFQGLGCVADDRPLEKLNLATPMLDLSNIYGNEGLAAASGRQWEGGRMRAEIIHGKEWAPSGGTVCINNERPNENRCHAAPNSGSNSLLGINLMFIWLYRQHNAIARELAALNPCWGDDRLYYTAREINIALANQMYYYEFMPEIVGSDYLVRHKAIFPGEDHVDDYDANLKLGLSIESTVASRWFHTLQEGRLKMYTQQGELYAEQSAVDFTLRTGALATNGTLEGVTQGVFRQPGAARDGLLDPDMGMRSLGRLQRVSDVLAADIMKGRLLGLAPYSRYRRLCGLPVPRSFQDLRQWMHQEQVDALSLAYESVEDIDFVAGTLAELGRELRKEGGTLAETDWGVGERQGEGRTGRGVGERQGEGKVVGEGRALAGETLACVLVEQMVRHRRADRFWYEHPDHPQAFNKAQLREIRKMSLAALLCRHGDGVAGLQPHPLRLPTHGNEIKSCKSIEESAPQFSVFADPACKHHDT